MLLSLRSNISILSSLYQVYYLPYLVWMSDLNLKLIKVLEIYEFTCQAHINFIIKLINKLMFNWFCYFCIEP